MKKYSILISLLASGALAFLAGCQTVNTVESASQLGTPNYVTDKRVITDSSLNSAVRILSVNDATVSGNLRRVQVMVKNTTNSDKRFNYRWDWYDTEGMQVQTPGMGWRTENIKPQETRALSATAPSPKAVDFKLNLQEPQ